MHKGAIEGLTRMRTGLRMRGAAGGIGIRQLLLLLAMLLALAVVPACIGTGGDDESSDPPVPVEDVPVPEVLLQLNGAIAAVAIERYGHEAVALAGQTAHLFDLASRSSRALPLPAEGRALALDAGRRLLVAGLAQAPGLAFLHLDNGTAHPHALELPSVRAVAVDAARGVAVVIRGDGLHVTTVDLDTRTSLAEAELPAEALDLALHTVTGMAYVLAADAAGSRLLRLDPASASVVQDMPLPAGGSRLAVDEDRHLAIVASPGAIALLDLNSGQIIANHAQASQPERLAVQPDAGLLAFAGNGIGLLDIPAGSTRPDYLAFGPVSAMAASARYNVVLVGERDTGKLWRVPLPSPLPMLDGLLPAEVDVGSPAFTLRASGSRFVDGAQLLFGDRVLPTQWSGPGALSALIPADALTVSGQVDVAVRNPAPTARRSEPLGFRIRGPNPVPVLTAIDPARIALSDPPVARTLRLTGKQFVPESVAHLGAEPLVTSYVSSTELRAEIPAALLTVPGTVPVTVFNPAPGGGVSGPVTLTIDAEAPRIDGFEPTAGPAGTLVTVRGARFDGLSPGGNEVRFNGSPAVVAGATSDTLRVIVPIGAQSGPIRVTTAGGTTQSSGSFTVQPLEEIALHPAPDAVTLPSGGHGYTVVSLENLGLIEYAQVLRLTVEGLPAGVQYRIDDNGLTLHRPATLVFFGTEGLAPGRYTVTVVAEGLIDGVLTRRTVEITLDVLAPGSTTLAGRVLHAEDDRPLAGIRIQLGDAVTHTDAAGHYLFRDPPSGEQVVLIDAGVLNTPEVHYPSRIPMPAHVIPNRANSVLTSYIAPVDATRYTAIVPGQAETVTDDQLPGYALNIPQGAVLTGWDDQPIDKVNVRRVPIDRLPIRPLPEGTAPKSVYLYYFFRPGGAEPSEPIPVTMINDLGLLPGEKADLWYYDESPEADPESNQWRIMGQGTVSADGQSIVSDPGVGIPKFCCGASFSSPPTTGGSPPGGDGGGCGGGGGGPGG
ncbi:MAG: IPT/TIG domain-containing protein, partial [Ectothiorhodospiraceae bacterium]|nr:IPT/TIG domain-containing protein [Ectothiorhodospiraceae bacterium]